jgi:hypothetical protein
MKTLVTFLLDRTGSMGSIKDDTIGGFNAYLKTLKESTSPIEFTFLQFDSVSLDKICVTEPVGAVAELTDATYQPRASTPLIDAAYKTIKAVEDALTKRDDKPKVVICIQTDGHENCSSEHSWLELNTLIKEKIAAGWQFNFMGAGIDAYDQASKMGIAAASTMSYDKHSAARTDAAFRSSAMKTSRFAGGLQANTAFSAADKQAAGDAFDPALKAPVAAPLKPKIVDDITL